MSIRSRFIRAALAAGTLVFASSCYYDGYYNSYGAYDSYGYSGGGVSFVYTNSDRWFYDPVVYCYYDRHRRAYYDPYLYGYYPAGYVPRPVYGVPHPHGWRPGQAYCPPPSNFRDRRLSNYNNRADLLRSSRQYSWAGSVRERNDSGVAAWQSRRLQDASRFPTRQQAAERGPGGTRENQWGSRPGGDANRRPGSGTPWNPSARPPETRDRTPSQRGNWQDDNRQPSRDNRGRVTPRPSFNQPVDTGAARQRQAEQQRAEAIRRQQAESHRARNTEGRQRSFEPRPAPPPRQETRPAPPPREEARPSSRGGGGGSGDGERERGRRGR